MARIAFAWEFGASYGHAVSCTGLGTALHARGHAIGFMFRELHQLAVLPETAAFDVFQAPRLPREGVGAERPASLADILLGCGYDDPRMLVALVGGWRALLRHWNPDLVVADFAPTALVAAGLLRLPRVSYGNGFFTPPRLSPLPPFRYDEPVDANRLRAVDARALASVNAALARFGAPPLARLCDLFETDEDFLCSFPEIDHYGTRPPAGYWGPRVRFDRGIEARWPQHAGRNIFVYVQRTLPQLDALIDALRSRDDNVIAFIPEVDGERRARLAAPHRLVADRPLRLDRLMKRCDLLVSLGGEIAGGALTFGVPQLVFPQQYEQYLLARRIEQLGAGGWIAGPVDAHAIAKTLDRLLADARAVTAARDFARRYPAFSPEEQRRRIVARIEAILDAQPKNREEPHEPPG
ncbi:MAG: nucleotide disphospho-sugar-binding domain-containing protein [Bacillota bacterium]